MADQPGHVSHAARRLDGPVGHGLPQLHQSYQMGFNDRCRREISMTDGDDILGNFNLKQILNLPVEDQRNSVIVDPHLERVGTSGVEASKEVAWAPEVETILSA